MRLLITSRSIRPTLARHGCEGWATPLDWAENSLANGMLAQFAGVSVRLKFEYSEYGLPDNTSEEYSCILIEAACNEQRKFIVTAPSTAQRGGLFSFVNQRAIAAEVDHRTKELFYRDSERQTVDAMDVDSFMSALTTSVKERLISILLVWNLKTSFHNGDAVRQRLSMQLNQKFSSIQIVLHPDSAISVLRRGCAKRVLGVFGNYEEEISKLTEVQPDGSRAVSRLLAWRWLLQLEDFDSTEVEFYEQLLREA